MAKRFNSTLAKIKNSDGVYEPIPALKGATPYEIAVRNGFEGTEEEWFNLNFDDGWVTRYQELENDKANKTDVYSKEYFDDFVEDHVTPLEERNSKFKPLWKELISLTEEVNLGTVLAISPNKQYFCTAGNISYGSSGGQFTVYLRRSSDGSVVDSFTYKQSESAYYGFPHVDMDNDFIAICYPSTGFTTYDPNGSEYSDTTYYYDLYSYYSGRHSYLWSFFSFNDESMTKVTLSGFNPTAYSRLPVWAPIANNGIGGSNNFWLLIEEAQTNDTYQTYHRCVYVIDKATKKATRALSVNGYSYASMVHVERNYRLYRDGDSAIVMYVTDHANGVQPSSLFVNIDRFSYTNGSLSTTKLYTSTIPIGTGSSSTNWTYSIRAVDTENSQIIICNGSTIRAYNFTGTVIRSKSFSTVPTFLEVYGDLIYYDGGAMDLNTFESVSTRYALSGCMSSTYGLDFTKKHSVPDRSVGNYLYASSLKPSNVPSSAAQLSINVHEFEIGGWPNE